MVSPLYPYDEIIEQILRSRDSYSAKRLFDRYDAVGNKDAFVAALIGQLLLENSRRTE